MQVNASKEVVEDFSFTEYPAIDTFHDESIASWPVITCSELGSERIRLVKITPGPPGSTIECEVRVCFLDQAPTYTAVSYTWGSPLGFRDVLIHGQPHSVPKNLWRFLDQARRLSGSDRFSGWLWIDALSIDQSDPHEKLYQVEIISSIFRNATHMIVWLGPSYANSDHALAIVYPCSTEGLRMDVRILAGPDWSALHSLCERPYWRRLWVYQELKSARHAELMCGSRFVPLGTLRDYLLDPVAPRLADKSETLRESSAGNMLGLVKGIGFGLSQKLVPISSLLRATNHLHCVDPRDKAYAVLNIAQTEKQGIRADYTITVPTLLNKILRNEPNVAIGLGLTDDLTRWGRECEELERLFGEPPNSMFVTTGPVRFDPHVRPLVDLGVDCNPTNLKLLDSLSEWAEFYSHNRISQSLLQRRQMIESNAKRTNWLARYLGN